MHKRRPRQLCVVRAFNWAEAKTKLQENQGARFNWVIASEERAAIVLLHGNFRVNTPDANLFIYD